MPNIEMSRGLKSTLRALNKSTISSIAGRETIQYDNENNFFVVDKKTKISASTEELNVISSLKDITEETCDEIISEDELIKFMNYLYDTPNFASAHPVGQKILKLVELLPRIEIPAGETFYHARVRDNDEIPFLNKEVFKAPVNVTGPGRYNHIGQSHFYCADQQDGAEKEVKIHLSKNEKESKSVAIALVVVTKPINITDLSLKSRRGY